MTRICFGLQAGIYSEKIISGECRIPPANAAGNPVTPARIDLAILAVLCILLVFLILLTKILLNIDNRQKKMLHLLSSSRKNTRKGNKGSAGNAGKGKGEQDEDGDENQLFVQIKDEQTDDCQLDWDMANKTEAADAATGSYAENVTSPVYQQPSIPKMQESKLSFDAIGQKAAKGISEPLNGRAPQYVCGVSVDGSANYNSQDPVTFNVDENGMMEFMSDNTIVPKKTCFSNYNTTAFFSRHDFFHVFSIQDRNGKQVGKRQQMHLLETRKPAYGRKESGSIVLMEKGVLIAEEK